jgi:hypothetical protein
LANEYLVKQGRKTFYHESHVLLKDKDVMKILKPSTIKIGIIVLNEEIRLEICELMMEYPFVNYTFLKCNDKYDGWDKIIIIITKDIYLEDSAEIYHYIERILKESLVDQEQIATNLRNSRSLVFERDRKDPKIIAYRKLFGVDLAFKNHTMSWLKEYILQSVPNTTIIPIFGVEPTGYLKNLKKFKGYEFINTRIQFGKSFEHIFKSHLNNSPQCSVCGKLGDLKKCSRCKRVYYCTKECQIKSWPDHKLNCIKAKSD